MGGTLPPSLSSHRHHRPFRTNPPHIGKQRRCNLPPGFEVEMNIQSQSASASKEERGARRQTLIRKGVVHHDDQSTDVRVRNISTTGAMIESRTPLAAGSQLRLELGNSVSVLVTVEWTIGDHAGVSFHSPVDLTRLAHARPAEPTWAPPTYLDSATQAAWERRLRRLSPAELRAEFEGYISD